MNSVSSVHDCPELRPSVSTAELGGGRIALRVISCLCSAHAIILKRNVKKKNMTKTDPYGTFSHSLELI